MVDKILSQRRRGSVHCSVLYTDLGKHVFVSLSSLCHFPIQQTFVICFFAFVSFVFMHLLFGIPSNVIITDEFKSHCDYT